MSISRHSIPEELLTDILNYIDAPWADGNYKMKIENIIASGMIYLNGKYGGEANYLTDGLPRTLLFDYTRYAKDNALDVFENNYRNYILAMQNEKAVNDYVEKKAEQNS